MTIKLKAALKMSTLSPEAKVTKGQFIIHSLQQAPQLFPTANLPIPLTAATTALTNLDASILAAAGGAPGSTSNMHEKERIVISILNIYRSYVEMVANGSADPKTVIEAAGMTAVTHSGGAPVTELTITPSGNGMVDISVPRQTGEAAFIYQYSTDGGNTWQEFECSKLASVQLKNQSPGSTVHIRFVAIGKTKGAFSQAKNTIVL